jgi:hypothetical protein
MLKLIDSPWGIFGQDLDGILIPQVVSPLDRVEHMPLPTILFLISQSSRNSPLCRTRVGSCGKYLADDRDIAGAGHFNGCPKARQTRANNYYIVLKVHLLSGPFLCFFGLIQ